MKVAWQVLSAFRQRIGLICVLTCAAFLALTACGSNSNTSSTSLPPTTTAESPAPAPSTSLPPTNTAGSPAPAPTSTFGPQAPAPSAPPMETDHDPWSPPAVAPGNPWSPPAVAPGFAVIQKAESGLVTANAYWRRPDALNVEQSQQIGLGIQSAPLTSQINQRINELPGVNQPAGQIKVSPHATARLEANPSDAEVTPSGSQNESTASDIQLSWMWTVRPKRPTSDLVLTAYVDVHLEGSPNDVLTTPITLHVPVHRTASYTAGQIFTNWKTWTGIVGAVAAGAAWILKRTKRKNQPSEVEGPPSGTQASGMEGSTLNPPTSPSVRPEGTGGF
jgi:hypothetical protein